MTTYLLLYTEPPTRRVFEKRRPGRLVFASDEITPEDRAVYDECVELPPIGRIDETMEILARVRADRVIAQTEYGLLPGALLGACPPESALLCTNKWLSRLALRDAGVPVPRFALAEHATEARRVIERYPVVIKPVVSTMGCGVRRIDYDGELEYWVPALRARIFQDDLIERCLRFAKRSGLDMGCDPTRQFLVEEYVEGTALETDGLVFGDRIDCFGTTEQIVSPPPQFFIEGYMFPADGHDLAAVTERAIRACKVRDMGFAVEFRGETVIEVNGRLGEDAGFPDLFEAALGSHPILKWMEGRESPSRVRARAALAYQNCYDAATVRALPPADGVRVLVRPGENHIPYGPHGPHLAVALRTHVTSSRAAYEEAAHAAGALRFEFAP